MNPSCDTSIKRLVKEKQDPNRKPLGEPKQRAQIPASRSTGLGVEAASDGEGSIASPLTEKAGTRTYHADQEITSSDGLFVLVWSPVEALRFSDDNGEDVDLRLDEP